MATRSRLIHSWANTTAAAVPWVIIAAGVVIALVAPQADATRAGEIVLMACLATFFSVLLWQLFSSGRCTGRRRTPLMLLGIGLCLWATGSTVLQAAAATTTISFPTPGETFFLLSYLGFAAFLLTDAPRRHAATSTIWLETAVVCGATVCAASFVVLTPVALAFERTGMPLLLALLYPMVDLALATLVISQMMLGQRARSLRTLQLVGGFLLLAAADSSFLLTLSDGFYFSSLLLSSLWGASLVLIVTAARTSPGELQVSQLPRDQSRTLVLAAAVATGVLLLEHDGVVGGVIVVAALVTLVSAGLRMSMALREARDATSELLLSRTDELTGLPNRRALLSDLDEALKTVQPMSLLLLDLDGFKDVNDSVGHSNGDALLINVADRLLHVFGSRMQVARLGGDEFAILVRKDDSLELMETANQISTLVSEPHLIDGLSMTVHASIGIAVRRGNDTKGTDMLRRSDVAMYEAKAARSGALLYDPSQDSFSRDRLQRTDELRRAIRGGQLEVWYQPEFDATTLSVNSVEALVRWRHPTDGVLQPISFLPEARRHGMMNELSVEVMRMVVADARRWVDEGFAFRVSMNCAPPELLGGVVLPRLYETLAETPLPPDILVLEVTEDSFMTDPARAREQLIELRHHHVQAAIDDYGSGFSSLAYLRDLPVQELKLDRSFVSTLLTDHRNRVIVDATRQMGHALGLRIVAEGVEDAATAATLAEMHVDVLQGFHLSRPMPAADVASWVRDWSLELLRRPVLHP
uniref:Diguanylate cyclase/phosphodiesterase (GGDEF & EAL domains) with PAS/PAC sensor(S) n=1 Tax=uncultured Nocardioidaceae bacterium TaxID=253824 RepID=A0A6J4L8D7_9ACTN|nr:MAG: diguanylate cyclase/phosphodiesterase (GGDEF & EAL domains) with PAS/PAC sensor(s) [uncultured Nocardioidaceae bacterium]